MDELIMEEQPVTSMPEGFESKCWGCGLRLVLPAYAHIFKCGWCGAVTNESQRVPENQCSYRWRRLRDRILVTILVLFMFFVIGGGVWAVYPVLFSFGYFCGIFHSIIAFILSITTLSSFCLAAFRSAGAPPSIIWGSYPVVSRGGLENYTFCVYCAKPKSPSTHHCRSCGMCVLDMDHHCPFIGNCVGAANHRVFIAFLFFAIISTTYSSVMSVYVGFNSWPPVANGHRDPFSFFSIAGAMSVFKEVSRAFMSSALLLSTRGLVLVYMFIASLSVQIGLSALLWQQLNFIYEGKTYLGSSDGENTGKGFQNLFRFFGCQNLASRYLLRASNAARKKIHEK